MIKAETYTTELSDELSDSEKDLLLGYINAANAKAEDEYKIREEWGDEYDFCEIARANKLITNLDNLARFLSNQYPDYDDDTIRKIVLSFDRHWVELASARKWLRDPKPNADGVIDV